MKAHNTVKSSLKFSCLKHSLLAAAIMQVLPLTAVAQNEADDASRAGLLEEVLVTAQKREESLSDVPISISVLDGTEIEKDSIQNFEEVDERVPNFFVARSPGADAIFIRGLGSGSGSPTLEQSVVMFVDEVYGGNARQFQTPWLDMQRVEILRGPQGTLVGKNTSAGAVRVISRRPGDEFEANLSAEYDFLRDGPTITGVLSGPVAEGFGLRGAVKYRDVGGYVYNSLTNDDEPTNKEFAGRLIGTYEVDSLSIMGKIEMTTLEGDGNPYVMTSKIKGRYLDRTKENLSSLGPDYDDNETTNMVLHIDYGFAGGHQLAAITGYSEYETDHGTDADFFENDLAYSTFKEWFDQTSQEIRLLSPTDQTFEYIVGVYWHLSTIHEERDTGALFAPPASSARDFDQDNETLSLYGNLTWNITDHWSLQGGLRYTDESKDASYIRWAGPLAFTQRTGAITRIQDSLSASNTDPSLILRWQPTDELMLYASYAEGYKSGGFQGAIPNATAAAFEFLPETAKSYEIGVKGAYDRFSYEVAAFDMSYEDLQVSSAINANPNTTVFAFFTGNAAEASSKGVEASGAFAVTESFLLNGSMAYLDASYDSYPDGPCAIGQAPDNPARGSCNLTGVDLQFAPKWSGSLTASYSHPITDNLGFSGDLTVNYRDDHRTEAAHDPEFLQSAYSKWDLRLALEIGQNHEVAVIGRNITDEYTFGFGGSGSLAANPVFGLAPDARMMPLDPVKSWSLQYRFTY
jgi:iron complex outermembrane receptor protein